MTTFSPRWGGDLSGHLKLSWSLIRNNITIYGYKDIIDYIDINYRERIYYVSI